MTGKLALVLALLLAAAGCGSSRTDNPVQAVSAAGGSPLLIDTHNDVTSDTVKGLDIGPRRTEGHTDIPRLREGSTGAVFFAAYVAADYAKKGKAAYRALEMIDTVRHDIVARHPDTFVLATTADEIEAAHRDGKIAALIGIEGGHAIENSLRLLRQFHALGVRYMTLTHSNTNDWADSSGDIDNSGVKHHGGLTVFGREVVAEMNRLGMMVDISHVADKTFWDVLEISKAPPFASHSSCRALSNIPRNMTDEMIVALAKKGGTIQINVGCEFLSQASADASSWTNKEIVARLRRLPLEERRKAAREIDAKMPRPTLADVVTHIDHVVKIAGIDAVGIGTDFDGVSCVPVGFEDVSRFPALEKALLEKGYSAAQIGKIFGGNILRVMRNAEQASGNTRN